MSQGVYTTLTRQDSLLREMDIVANNIANANTTGFRSGAMIFSEFVESAGRGAPSLSMAQGNGKIINLAQGTLERTGGTFDFAIEGDGFFQVQGADGIRLTRNGSFTPDTVGNLVTAEGLAVLDAGGAPIFVPPGAESVHLASDGTLSADGLPVAQLGLVRPQDMGTLERVASASFRTDDALVPVTGAQMIQGFLESSNVEPVVEIARMIAVQHAYQAGQAFLQREDERMRSITRLMES